MKAQRERERERQKGKKKKNHIRICLCHSLLPLFCSCALLKTYITYAWKTTHLVKLHHSNLSCNLGLTPTSRWVGLKPVGDFPRGPKPCHLGLPSPVFWPKCKLVQFKDLAHQGHHIKPFYSNPHFLTLMQLMKVTTTKCGCNSLIFVHQTSEIIASPLGIIHYD